MDPDAFFLLLIVLIVVVFGYGFWANARAKVQRELETDLSGQDALVAVVSAFPRVLWKEVDGPGTVNMKRRAWRDEGPTVSIDVYEGPASGSTVHCWMSEWSSRVGVISFAGAARRAMNRIELRLLRASAARSTVAG